MKLAAETRFMVHLDSNYLVDALVPGSSAEAMILSWLAARETLAMSAVAWGEFLFGPLSSSAESAARQTVTTIESLQQGDGEQAAKLFNQTGRRSRIFQDCMIAAAAIRCRARLATLNTADFVPFVPYGLTIA
ncbi:MAG: PIN domain-containing protein [Verrucomicrobia bacterium]|nr:PIN domain-containing protein [Verrucomicrobiota bacterium]